MKKLMWGSCVTSFSNIFVAQSFVLKESAKSTELYEQWMWYASERGGGTDVTFGWKWSASYYKMMQGSSSLNFVFFSFLNIFLAKRDSENRKKRVPNCVNQLHFVNSLNPLLLIKKYQSDLIWSTLYFSDKNRLTLL